MLRTFTKTGDAVRSLALDVYDGKNIRQFPQGSAGGLIGDTIYLASSSRQTMLQIDKRTGASLMQTPAPTKNDIYAQAADACYVYFSSGDVVSRVPRARPAR